MQPTLIYRGPGAEPQGPERLKNLYHLCMGPDNPVSFVGPEDLTVSLNKKTPCLIFPGGADIPYHAFLKGKSNQAIKRYVEEGGCYVGICAGAYYGCKEILFEEGGELEVKAERELCFFNGKAVGPAYGNGMFNYHNAEGALAATIAWTGLQTSIYYNGGCYFKDVLHDREDISILARYADLPGAPAAALACQIGQGRAVLCGVHPEMEAEHICDTAPCSGAIRQTLGNNVQERVAFFRYLLDFRFKQ